MPLLNSLKRWWNLNNFWATPEIIFKRQAKENPLYPFEEQDDMYVMTVFNFQFYLGIVLFLFGGFGELLYWNQMGYFSNDLFDTMFILSALYGLRLLTFHWSKRRIAISKDVDEYFFYIGKKVAHKGQIHNIYIRLRSQRSSNGQTYYRIVLNGFNVEEQTLTSLTPNKSALESMAKNLANKLNVNYFDSEDVSMLHIVRHINPYTFYMRPTKPHVTSRKTKRMSVARATLEAFY